MAKVRVYDVDRESRYRMVGEFLLAVSKLRTKKDAVSFLVGLLTSSELLMVARRIQIAKLILKNKNYPEIRDEGGCKFSDDCQNSAVALGWREKNIQNK